MGRSGTSTLSRDGNVATLALVPAPVRRGVTPPRPSRPADRRQAHDLSRSASSLRERRLVRCRGGH